MRPVIVGIAPSRAGSEGQPLSSLGGRSTGATLAELAGLDKMEYLQRFDRINLCPEACPSTIPVSRGRPNAENLVGGGLLRGRRVILLGANVADCFGIPERLRQPCVWTQQSWTNKGWAGWRAGERLPAFSFAVLPHPSGRNPWYNNAENKALARAFMTELAEGWEGAD